MNEQKIHLQELLTRIFSDAQKLRRYSVTGFIVLVVLLYGFLFFRITLLNSQQPSEVEISKQVKASPIPHIDKNIVEQLRTLEDNSVNVQALFNQARNNPFQ